MLPTVQIIYASTSGNTEAVCEHVAKTLDISRINSELHRAERTGIDQILSNKFLILATSTWEHGVINPYFDKLLEKLPQHDLSGKYSGFIGLGDTRYEPVLFCEGIEILRRDFTDAGGRQIGTTLKINGDPYDHMESLVTDWTEQLILQLRRYA